MQKKTFLSHILHGARSRTEQELKARMHSLMKILEKENEMLKAQQIEEEKKAEKLKEEQEKKDLEKKLEPKESNQSKPQATD